MARQNKKRAREKMRKLAGKLKGPKIGRNRKQYGKETQTHKPPYSRNVIGLQDVRIKEETKKVAACDFFISAILSCFTKIVFGTVQAGSCTT